MSEPVIVAEDADELLEKLIGRQVVGLAFVPHTNAVMLHFDADTAVYFRIVDNRLQVEIEAPSLH